MSDQLYARPVRCKYCDRIFDFPTLTTDITERDVPVRTRVCGSCLWEMGQNEALRAARAKDSEANNLSVVSLSERPASLVNAHKASVSSTTTNGDSDTTSRSTGSPEQPHSRLQQPMNSPQLETLPSLESRTSGVHSLLN